MSDETQCVIMIDDVVEPAAARRMEDHWCEHPGCKKWGSFGFTGRYGTEWYCGEHRGDGE